MACFYFSFYLNSKALKTMLVTPNFVFVFAFIAVASTLTWAQKPAKAKFKLEVSSDTIDLHEVFDVSYKFSNLTEQPSVNLPEFKDWRVLSGPNMSSQVLMQNGNIDQSLSYSYRLQPLAEGVFELPPIQWTGNHGEMLEKPTKIVVKKGFVSSNRKKKSSAVENFFTPTPPTHRLNKSPKKRFEGSKSQL